MSVRTRFSSHLFWVFLQLCFLPLSTKLLFLMVLFFLALGGGVFCCWMLLFRLFLRPSSFRFCCCRHIVGLLLIASDLDFPWGLLFHQVLFIVVLFILFFSAWYHICSEGFFSLVSPFLLPSSCSEWFCSCPHFLWRLSSHCAFPGVGNMCHSL